jgi:hypothetical protein
MNADAGVGGVIIPGTGRCPKIITPPTPAFDSGRHRALPENNYTSDTAACDQATISAAVTGRPSATRML